MSTSLTPLFVGIDVSCETLDIAWRQGQGWRTRKIPNTWQSVQSFTAELAAEHPECYCILEYTGTYSSKIALALHQAKVRLSLITPTQSKAFATMKHRTTKNDKSDACLLAEYGLTNASDLRLYNPPSEDQVRFRQLLGAMEQLEKMLHQVRNQRHAYEQHPPAQQQQIILDSYQNTENQLVKQIEELNQSLQSIDDHEEDLEQTRTLMTSVKGIGPKTANVILAKTRGIKRFKSYKQLSKFAGIAPTEETSGTTVRRRRSINRTGSAALRKALYCATWSALRGNKACKALFDRLKAKGKPAKVALIAVANLLLRQIYAVVNTQKLFDNDIYLKNCAVA